MQIRTSFFHAIFFAVIIFLSANDAQAQPPAKKATKAQDPALAKITDDPNLPRVLLIGDSISIGYTIETRKLLKGAANVHRIPENGGPTHTALTKIDGWLEDGKWDVIHFNWGLHDLKQMDGKHQVPLDQYEANLRKLVERMKKTGAALIWCSTTPVPEGKLSPPRTSKDVLAYNAAAKKVMDEQSIATDDLYEFALPQLAAIQIPQNVHFKPDGSAVLAKKVAGEIRNTLEARAKGSK